MSITLRRDPRTVVPDIIDWFEEPFLTLRPYLGHAIRIEDYTEDGHYVVRAEVAGLDPDKELEVLAGAGYLTIRAARSDSFEGKHRSEFRYGTFNSIGRQSGRRPVIKAAADPCWRFDLGAGGVRSGPLATSR
jgi:HSP20 family molecular chaperone IbpA